MMMMEQDTLRLLRECDAGIKMGISSIDDVLDYVSDDQFKRCLMNCKMEHLKIQDEVQNLLNQYHDEGKDPSPVSKGMSWLKTNAKLVMNESDKTIADLLTDGCHMGIKSLNRYLNQYQAADGTAKAITIQLIGFEEKLVKNICMFL